MPMPALPGMGSLPPLTIAPSSGASGSFESFAPTTFQFRSPGASASATTGALSGGGLSPLLILGIVVAGGIALFVFAGKK